MRVHLPEDQFFVSTALPAHKTALQNIDIATAAAYLDYINLMAYDFSGPWAHRSGHHAQLYALNKDETSGSSSVSYLVHKGCPAKKIILGIPVYVTFDATGTIGANITLSEGNGSLSAQEAPFASLDLAASAGAGFNDFLSAGVEGSLNLVTLSVPLQVDAKAAGNWDEAH